jgi:hypothetical protein
LNLYFWNKRANTLRSAKLKIFQIVLKTSGIAQKTESRTLVMMLETHMTKDTTKEGMTTVGTTTETIIETALNKMLSKMREFKLIFRQVQCLCSHGYIYTFQSGIVLNSFKD